MTDGFDLTIFDIGDLSIYLITMRFVAIYFYFNLSKQLNNAQYWPFHIFLQFHVTRYSFRNRLIFAFFLGLFHPSVHQKNFFFLLTIRLVWNANMLQHHKIRSLDYEYFLFTFYFYRFSFLANRSCIQHFSFFFSFARYVRAMFVAIVYCDCQFVPCLSIFC